MKARVLFVLVALSLSCLAEAQNCGGMPAVNGVCIPPDSPTSPLNSTYGQQPGQPAVLPMKWADRWGAIATDATNGGVGAAASLPSKRKAEKAALATCRTKGGSGCKIALSYYNQCAAMAWGASYATTTAAATIEEASDNAIARCSEHTTDCQIYYADCSMAERVQ